MIRQLLEQNEEQLLCDKAQKAKGSKGRNRKEEESEYMTAFQVDRSRIVYSKAFRRLKHKTQVFLAPEGDHYRTRLTHTLEVNQIARTIARALRLNEDLTEAIALGHDLGHTPFGHAGESALNKVCTLGFRHYEQSLRVVDVLEGDGGLNLTSEVRDGILNHTGENFAHTLEGQIIKFADRTAYINHDIEDAIRGQVLCREDLPKNCLQVLGGEFQERIKNTILDIVKNSKDAHKIKMSEEFQLANNELRAFLFKNVYLKSSAKRDEDKAMGILEVLYGHYLKYPEQIPESVHANANEPMERIVCDYIAGMTDRFAIHKFQEIYVPRSWY